MQSARFWNFLYKETLRSSGRCWHMDKCVGSEAVWKILKNHFWQITASRSGPRVNKKQKMQALSWKRVCTCPPLIHAVNERQMVLSEKLWHLIHCLCARCTTLASHHRQRARKTQRLQRYATSLGSWIQMPKSCTWKSPRSQLQFASRAAAAMNNCLGIAVNGSLEHHPVWKTNKRHHWSSIQQVSGTSQKPQANR